MKQARHRGGPFEKVSERCRGNQKQSCNSCNGRPRKFLSPLREKLSVQLAKYMLRLVDNYPCTMDYLTTRQIDDFNNPLAFARDRLTTVGQSLIGTDETSPIVTGSMEESYSLVVGASDRLETLHGNLSTMLDLATKGSRVGGNERKAAEYYGKIRSLTAGFDQIVDAIRFDKQPIFTNRNIRLEMETGGRDIDLEPIRLLTYGEDSLNLSETMPSADISVDFFTDDQIVNSGYDIIGLNLTGGSYHDSGKPTAELENGIYKIDIAYAGADSSVSIRTREGELVQRLDNIDLSGTGSQWVDFDQGVRLNFDMESLFTSFDKYDFENKGPAQLSATMTYKRIDRQLIRTEDGPAQNASAELLFESPLRIGETSIRVFEPTVAPVEDGARALKTGNYNIEIDYHASNSVVRLRDSVGRIAAYEFGVDLSAQGTQKINFGNGLSFNFSNDGFVTEGAQYSTSLKYTAETNGLENFDFRDYQSRIRDALKIIEEQQAVIAETKSKIEEINMLKNQANTSVPNAAAFNASSALGLLSGGGGVGIFASVSPGARFGMLSEQLFQTTTAFPTQANQSPEALAQLSKNGSVGSLLSTFT